MITGKISWQKNPFRNSRSFENSPLLIPREIPHEVRKFHVQIPEYFPTPLHSLDILASDLGLERIWVKDESSRFGLNSFKVLGGTYALYRRILQLTQKEQLSFSELVSPQIAKSLKNITFAAATAGNHGKGLAWAAQKLGQKVQIYVNKFTAPARITALKQQGAHVTVIDGTYDDSVRALREAAAKFNWEVIADTAWEGYEEVPLRIMQGYTTLLDEIREELEVKEIPPPTHLFVQAGVGSFAAAVAGFYESFFGNAKPICIVVEPHGAACFYDSIRIGDGKPHLLTEREKTMMAGLDCAEPNPLAWKLLARAADYFLSCSDEVSATGMKKYADPTGKDPRIISGESGAVTLGALIEIMTAPEHSELRKEMRLGKDSRVLFFNTEGATDPENYRRIVGSFPKEK